MGFALKLEDLPHYTIPDWEQWEGNWELINGVPYAMSPAPDSAHQWISGELFSAFKEALSKCEKCKVWLPVNLKFTDDTVVIPDLAVFCKPVNNVLYFENTPELVVEILSSSIAQKDLNVKFELYRVNGVKYYIVVNPKNNTVKIFELKDGKYHTVFEVGEGNFTFDLPECRPSVDFSKIW